MIDQLCGLVMWRCVSDLLNVVTAGWQSPDAL